MSSYVNILRHKPGSKQQSETYYVNAAGKHAYKYMYIMIKHITAQTLLRLEILENSNSFKSSPPHTLSHGHNAFQIKITSNV